MKYVDASAVLRILFNEPGASVPLVAGDRVVSSQLLEVETFQAVDRARLLSHLDDAEAALKRKELGDLLARLDVGALDDAVIARAKSPFAINVRALDALHVATAEVLAAEAAGEPLEFTSGTRLRNRNAPSSRVSILPPTNPSKSGLVGKACCVYRYDLHLIDRRSVRTNRNAAKRRSTSHQLSMPWDFKSHLNGVRGVRDAWVKWAPTP